GPADRPRPGNGFDRRLDRRRERRQFHRRGWNSDPRRTRSARGGRPRRRRAHYDRLHPRTSRAAGRFGSRTVGTSPPMPSLSRVIGEITLRRAESPADYFACQQAQRLAWGITEDGYVIPVATMVG